MGQYGPPWIGCGLGRKRASRIRWAHGNDGAWGEEMFKKKMAQGEDVSSWIDSG
jgi:hypothetical protein